MTIPQHETLISKDPNSCEHQCLIVLVLEKRCKQISFLTHIAAASLILQRLPLTLSADAWLCIHTCNGACILGRLPLTVIEVSGHCDDGFLNWLVQPHKGLSCVPHFGQHHAADFFRAELLGLRLELHLNHGLVTRGCLHCEREVLDIFLQHRITANSRQRRSLETSAHMQNSIRLLSSCLLYVS